MIIIPNLLQRTPFLFLLLSFNAVAEVVGSTPTLSIFINLADYGIEMRLFQVIVGQNSPVMSLASPIGRTFR
jgi:hypothetical protein